MIPRLSPSLGLSEIYAALNIFKKDAVAEFENRFAEKMGQKHAISFPHGRTGIIMTLKAWGFENKEIICPAFTCIVVAHAIVTSGNIPVFVNGRESDFNMDLNEVEAAITDKTGAIIATSLMGNPIDLDHLARINKKYPHVKIMQDCAHSFAAEWNGKPVQKEGDCAVFGLNASKLITSIFGGMITTDNDDLAHNLRNIKKQHLTPPSRIKSIKRFLYLAAIYIAFIPFFYRLVYFLTHCGALNKFTKYYDENLIDMPNDYLEDMTEIAARVGISQLKKYDQIIAERRKVAAYYDQHLKDHPDCQKPKMIEGSTFSHYVVRLANRDEFRQKAAKYGVEIGQWMECCLPLIPAYRNYRGTLNYDLTKELSLQTANLPLSKGIYGAHKTIRAIHKILGYPEV